MSAIVLKKGYLLYKNEDKQLKDLERSVNRVLKAPSSSRDFHYFSILRSKAFISYHLSENHIDI